MKIISKLLITVLCLTFSLTGCTHTVDDTKSTISKSSITIAAASSLKNCMDDELIPIFQEKYPDIKIQTTYDSSGKLQMQIEEGAPIDVFISASMKQMTALDEKGLILENSMVNLLENKIVLIVPKNSTLEITTFEDILKADRIAIGDPESVPAGLYAKEVLTNFNIWEKSFKKTSLGTNVIEVLNWIAEGSADVGIVYSTDVTSNQSVKIVAEAPEGSASKVIYPIGIINSTKEIMSSKIFIDFLKTNEAKKIFESYGFIANN